MMQTAGSSFLRTLACGVAVLTGAHALAAASLVALQRSSGEVVLPHLTVAREPVVGYSYEGLVARLEQDAEARLRSEIQVMAGQAWLQSDRREMGLIIDSDSAVDAAWVHGRLGLWTAIGHHLDAHRGVAPAIELVEHLDSDRFERWAQAAAEDLSREPQPAQLRLEVGDDDESLAIEVILPVDGQHVTAADVAAAVRPELDKPGRRDVEVAVERTLAPPVTGRDLAAVEEHAKMAVSAPVTLVGWADGADLVLPPELIARMLDVVRDDAAAEGERLRLAIGPDRFRDVIGDDDVSEVLTRATNTQLSALSAQLLELTAQPAPRLMELPQQRPSQERVRTLLAAQPA